MAFIGEKDTRIEASVLKNFIKSSVKFLQRPFKMFKGKNKDPFQTQGEQIEMETFGNMNGPENVILYNGKRKYESNVTDASNLRFKKRVKETMVNSSFTHESIRETHKTKCLETIIINDNGFFNSQYHDKIINEKNKRSIILSRVQADIKVDDGLSFNPTTKSSVTPNIVSLSQKYVDEFFKTTGIDLTDRRKTVNRADTCGCLGP